MSLASELVNAISTGTTGLGVTKYDPDSQTGQLFDLALPDESFDAIAISARGWRPAPNQFPGYHRVEIHIDSQGVSSMEDKHWIVTKFLRDRNGTERIFRPIVLTSFEVEQIIWTETGPGLSDAFPRGGGIAFRWKQRLEMIVKER